MLLIELVHSGFVTLVLAGTTDPGSAASDMQPITTLLNKFMSWAVALGTPMTALIVIGSCYGLMGSGLNVQQREMAKTAIKWSVIGFIGILGAWWFTKKISDTVKFDQVPGAVISGHQMIAHVVSTFIG